jgi:hypothetical protein
MKQLLSRIFGADFAPVALFVIMLAVHPLCLLLGVFMVIMLFVLVVALLIAPMAVQLAALVVLGAALLGYLLAQRTQRAVILWE